MLVIFVLHKCLNILLIAQTGPYSSLTLLLSTVYKPYIVRKDKEFCIF